MKNTPLFTGIDLSSDFKTVELCLIDEESELRSYGVIEQQTLEAIYLQIQYRERKENSSQSHKLYPAY